MSRESCSINTKRATLCGESLTTDVKKMIWRHSVKIFWLCVFTAQLWPPDKCLDPPDMIRMLGQIAVIIFLFFQIFCVILWKSIDVLLNREMLLHIARLQKKKILFNSILRLNILKFFPFNYMLFIFFFFLRKEKSIQNLSTISYSNRDNNNNNNKYMIFWFSSF